MKRRWRCEPNTRSRGEGEDVATLLAAHVGKDSLEHPNDAIEVDLEGGAEWV